MFLVEKLQFLLCYIVTVIKVEDPKHDEGLSFAEKLWWL